MVHCCLAIFILFFVRLRGPHSDQPNWAYHETKHHLFPTSLPEAPTQTTQPRFPNLTEPEPEPLAPTSPLIYITSHLLHFSRIRKPNSHILLSSPLLPSNSNKISFFISAAPRWVFFSLVSIKIL